MTRRVVYAADGWLAAEHHTGPVHRAETAQGGMNSAVAALLHTDRGPVFVKGIPAGHPQAAAQRREAAVAPHLPPSCPCLYWSLESGGWILLGYEVLAATDRFPSWQNASPRERQAFAQATVSLWQEITSQDPSEWKQRMLRHAQALAQALDNA